jgi:hypothetical protein
MDCRTFHKNLEDYLQDGLDFAGRFGMERHAHQCFGCGKKLADAQNLRRLAAGLVRVKAPMNFEASVSAAIAQRRTQSLLYRLRNYWSISFQWPSWQRMALAASTLGVLGFAMFYAMHRESLRPEPAVAETASPVAPAPIKINPAATPAPPVAQPPVVTEIPQRIQGVPNSERETPEIFQNQDMPRTETVDYLLVGPDNQPMPDTMPNRLYMRYGPPSDEYFIRNVSH